MELKSLLGRLLTVLLTVFVLVACTETPSKQTIGAGTGAVLGGVLGSRVGDHSTAATIGGTILGAVIGGAIGKRMDEGDRQKVYNSLENNEATSWTNPDKNATYTFDPTNTYHTSSGRLCRDYTSSVVIEGRRENATGRACKREDGTWEIVS